jgi:diguanylate cyclase (GGDEF)-like protein
MDTELWIRETTNAIRKLFAISSDNLCIIDRDERILAVSPGLLDAFSYQHERDLIRKKINTILCVSQANDSFLENRTCQTPYVWGVSKTGERFEVYVKTIPIDHFGEHGVLTAINIKVMKGIEGGNWENKYIRISEVLRETAAAIYSNLEFDKLLESVLSQIKRVISFDSASISLIDGEDFKVVASVGFEGDKQINTLRFKRFDSNGKKSPNQQSIDTKRAIMMHNVLVEYPDFVHLPDRTILSWMVIPLYTKETGIGTLNLDSYIEDHFTMEDIQVGEIFASQVSTALENSNLYSKTANKAEELAVLNEIIQAIHLEQQPDKLLEITDLQLHKFIGSQCFIAALHEPSRQAWRTLYQSGIPACDSEDTLFPLTKGVAGQIISNGESVHLGDLANPIAMARSGIDFCGQTPSAVIGVPLILTGTVFGALVCMKYGAYEKFSDYDFRLLQAISGQISAVLRNALHYQEMERAAYSDALTGLCNRRQLFRLLNLELARFNPETYPISFILLDFDHFKQINDRFGHLVGDTTLQSVADACIKHFRRTDIVCRIGGDEFLAVMPDTSLEDAVTSANRLCQEIAAIKIKTPQEFITVQVSIGVSAFHKGENDQMVLERTDSALMTAKANGRNRVVVIK